jgi:hypothetical protein
MTSCRNCRITFRQRTDAGRSRWVARRVTRHVTSIEDLARRFDRSPGWVSRRLALLELLPEEVQQRAINTSRNTDVRLDIGSHS